jgi:hypothetical protein
MNPAKHSDTFDAGGWRPAFAAFPDKASTLDVCRQTFRPATDGGFGLGQSVFGNLGFEALVTNTTGVGNTASGF